MDGNEPLNYIEKIVLEILDRPRFRFHQWCAHRIEKFNIKRFNPREAAYVFLRKYDGEPFLKGQKITVWYNNQKLYLCVRDLIYGKINKNSNRISNSMVEFIYRKALFSEIKWPTITVNRTNRVRWANDNNELSTLKTMEPLQNEISIPMNVMDIQIDGDYSSIDVNETANVRNRIVPCISCNNLDGNQSLSVDSFPENTTTSFCRDCRSVSGLQKLMTGDDGTLTLVHVKDGESHFRSSIYIRVNQ